MTRSLHARLDRIEAKRSALLERLAGTKSTRLSTPARPGGWSILEIVEHLVRAEDAVLGELDDAGAVADRPAHRRTLRQRLLHLVVLLVLRFRIPVSAPSRAMLPRGGASLESLRRRWEANHRQLREVVDRLGASGAGRAIFHHPVSGPITTRQALRLLEIHLDRHLGQIRAIEKAEPWTR